jgi:hypothetical protein
MSDANTSPDSVTLVYDEIVQAFDRQRAALESIEGKASNMMGFSSAVLAILLGSIQQTELSGPVRASVIVGAAFTLTAILIGGIVFWSRRMRTDPSPGILLEKFYDKDERATRLQVAVNRIDAYEENHRRIERIATFLRVGMAAQTGAVIALAVAVILLAV